MTRQECNIEILDNLYDYIVAHPDERFHQVLQNTYVVTNKDSSEYWYNEFYTESKDLLDRMTALVK